MNHCICVVALSIQSIRQFAVFYKTQGVLNIKPSGWDSGTVGTHLPPTSEVGGSNYGPHVGKFLVSYQLSTVYS